MSVPSYSEHSSKTSWAAASANELRAENTWGARLQSRWDPPSPHRLFPGRDTQARADVAEKSVRPGAETKASNPAVLEQDTGAAERTLQQSALALATRQRLLLCL